MRFMVMVRSTKLSEQSAIPDAKLMAEMGKFNEEMVKAGVLLAGEGLQPSAMGARVHFAPHQKPRVVDGPFAETKELIAGFWILQVKSKEEAVEWMRRCPAPFGPDVESVIEIRKIFELEDFAAADPTGELRAKEAELRKQVAAKH